MATNCNTCKWQKIRVAGKAQWQRLGITEEDLNGKCEECLVDFKAKIKKNPPTCYECAWKDRNLPYEKRAVRCKACVEAFCSKTDHDCTKCPWNDPKRRMPTDAALAHCKACLSISDGSEMAMNCESCKWREMPDATRRSHCLTCSVRFASSSKVRNSTNELSNKGQTIVSYDNHNPGMEDDRDNVSQLADDSVEKEKMDRDAEFFEDENDGDDRPIGEDDKNRERYRKGLHPIYRLADKMGISSGEYGEFAYEMMKRFLYELGQLSDMQALLLLSEVRGDKKTVFARNHNITDSAVNILSKHIMGRSTVFREFVILLRGSAEGTRGRKAKNGGNLKKERRNVTKNKYAGVFQQELGF